MATTSVVVLSAFIMAASGPAIGQSPDPHDRAMEANRIGLEPGRQMEAIGILREVLPAVEGTTNRASVLYNIYALYNYLGKYPEAWIYLAQMLQVMPDDSDAGAEMVLLEDNLKKGFVRVDFVCNHSGATVVLEDGLFDEPIPCPGSWWLRLGSSATVTVSAPGYMASTVKVDVGNTGPKVVGPFSLEGVVAVEAGAAHWTRPFESWEWWLAASGLLVAAGGGVMWGVGLAERETLEKYGGKDRVQIYNDRAVPWFWASWGAWSLGAAMVGTAVTFLVLDADDHDADFSGGTVVAPWVSEPGTYGAILELTF